MTAPAPRVPGLVRSLALTLCAAALLGWPGSAVAEDGDRPMDEKAQAAELIAGMKAKDPAERLKAAEAARDLQHDSLTSPLVRLLGDKELSVREAAIASLATRGSKSAARKAASSLAARLARLGKHVADEVELMATIEALRALQQPTSMKALLDGIHIEMDLEQVEARLFAVASVPHADAIEILITFLAKGRRGGRGKHRELANRALRYATGASPQKENRKAGHDADRWRAWWRENEKTFSFQAVQDARDEAAAQAAAKAERKRKAKEKREKQLEERKAKRKKKEGRKPKPAPAIPD